MSCFRDGSFSVVQSDNKCFLIKDTFPPTVRKELLGGIFGKVQMYLSPFLCCL